MTAVSDATTTIDEEDTEAAATERWLSSPPPSPSAEEWAAISARGPDFGYRDVFRLALAIMAALLLAFVLNLVLLGRLEHSAAQHTELDHFRSQLSLGTAPLGQVGTNGHLVPIGTSIALLKIPAIGLSQVVDEGTTGAVLMHGPGHRRDTPFPGQGGEASYILGREAAYGGPFSRIHSLKPGDRITVVTQEGTSTFKVVDVRHPGSPELPALTANQGRLTLETASGTAFVPSGVVFVDAAQTSPVFASTAPGLSLGTIPSDEKAMATDTGTVWRLVLWMEAVLVLFVGAVWSWRRWGPAQTWVVFVPLFILVSYFVSNQVTLLLPNLL
jgi:sortase A